MNSDSAATTKKETHTLNVLVVEDDLFQRLLISDLLESYEYEGLLKFYIFSKNGAIVNLAPNGKVALEMLLKDDITYDLILLDYMMPEMV